MNISEHISADSIRINLHGNDITEIMQELSRIVAGTASRLDSAQIFEDLMRREELLSTAMGFGVAFPHCTARKIKQPLFALGISRRGIEAGSPDQKPVHLFFVVVSPQRNPGAHLDALSAASRLFIKPEVRDAILDAASSDEAYQIITATEKNA